MADLMEIGDIVKKCKILLLDIEGTTTSISFVKDELFPYAEKHVQGFLESHWTDEEVQQVVDALRKLALDDKEKGVEGLVAIPGEDATKEEQVEGLVNNVKWQMSQDRKVGPLKQLQGLIWKSGYDKGELKGHVYDDVAPALESWRSVDGRKVYIYSSGSVAAQKLLFGCSAAGDLLPHIHGHFDTAVGGKQEADSYANIVKEIGCKPDEVLFLTDIVKEAEAARAAGLHAAVVTREGSAPAAGDFAQLTSLAVLSGNKRRAQDTQDESEQPAKIAKTDTATASTVDESVKCGKDTTAEEPEKNGKEDTETMEVEEAVAVETLVEDVSEGEAAQLPVVDIEPVVDDDSSTNGSKPSPPVEIQEVTGIEDAVPLELTPVIEEPNIEADMAELHHAGEKLDKECSDILTKVRDVTSTVPETSASAEADLEDAAAFVANEGYGNLDDNIASDENTSQPAEDTVKENDMKKEMNEPVQEKVEERLKDEVDTANPVEENGVSKDTEKASETPAQAIEPTTENAQNGTDKVTKTCESVSEPKDNTQNGTDKEPEPTKTENEVMDSAQNGKEHTNINETSMDKQKVEETTEPALNGSAKVDEAKARFSVENGKELNGANGDAGDAAVCEGKAKCAPEPVAAPVVDVPTQA